MKNKKEHFQGDNLSNKKSETGSREQKDRQEELIGGRHAVLEALKYSKPLKIFLTEGLKGAVVNEITLLARQKSVPVKRLSKEDFNRTAGDISGSQGVAAVITPFRYSSLSRLIESARSFDSEPFLIMLDHIEDPQNLGAVMRTADAAGVHGLIIPEQRAAGVTAAVCKVAAGAAERIPVALVGNLNRAAAMLKKEGFWLYGAEADGKTEYYRADYCRPLALVIGSEGKGLSRLLRKNCDMTLNIPMPGSAGSLNVAAATAILTYAALAQREGWTG